MTYAHFAGCNDYKSRRFDPATPIDPATKMNATPVLEAELPPNLTELGQHLNGRNGDPDGQRTITTEVVPCGMPPPKSLFPTVGDSLIHFQLISELGAGAFSRVFLASQQDLAGRFVALKISECTDGEPQRLARLQHANIVPIYSVHTYFQFQVVCMPYVGSHTLAT